MITVSPLEAIAWGITDPPASEDHAEVDRWAWFAGLYADRRWGLVSAIPTLPYSYTDQVAVACRLTGLGRATLTMWRRVAGLVETGIVNASSNGERLAWSAIADTVTDAYDHISGRQFSGTEAVLGVFAAVHSSCSARGAARFVATALAEWEALIDPYVRRTA
ncbi:hypothetical protein ACFYVR_23290 [Rhodococcus sp. NPDC003318]|uniref:hypothetical protein n=1 Tax=Rhodococcus sp. NPDC003318 TaxID=3364503 RepID=UPI0036BF516D